MNKRNLYWTLQLTGWLLYIFINYLSLPLFNETIPYEEVYFIGSFFTGIIVTHLYRFIIKNYNWFNLPLYKLTINVFAGAFLATIAFFIGQTIFNVIFLLAGKWLFHINMQSHTPQDPSFWAFFYLSILNCYFVFIIWSVLYFVFQYFENFQSAKVKALKAETQLKDATLQNLRNQINPHFLFNALNSIKALTVSEPEKARMATTLLSEILRYSLDSEKKSFVLLSEEVEVVKDYLELEKIRFGDRLTFTIETEPATLNIQVPPIVLLTLAENAIKHGISTLKNGGLVILKTYVSKNQLMIEVRNTGQFIANSNEGIGLKNTAQRIHLIYGINAGFEIKNSSDTEVAVTLYLPLTS